MHPDTSTVTVDQTADHQLLLMQSGLGTQKLQDQRRQILLIEYSIHNNNKSFRKKVSESLPIMEQAAIQKNCVTAAVLLLYEFALPIHVFRIFPPIFQIPALKMHIINRKFTTPNITHAVSFVNSNEKYL